MPTINDTAYPRLRSNLTTQELASIFTPTAEEKSFANENTRTKSTYACFLILLKTFQRLGYAVPYQDIPVSIIRHITVELAVTISSQELKEYDGSNTRSRHLLIIRQYLGLQAYGTAAQQAVEKVLETEAQTKHDMVDLINLSISELVRQRFELPAFRTIQRLAEKVRNQVTQACYQQIVQILEREDISKIDRLFLSNEERATSLWHQLKQDPGRPTITRLQELINRLEWLKGLRVGHQALQQLTDEKIKHFAAEAEVLEANQMKELRPPKRYTLAVCCLSVQYAQTLDDLAEMFIKCLQKIHHRGVEALEQYRKESQSRVDALISTFHEVLTAFQTEGSITKRFKAIAEVIGDNISDLLEQCDAQLAYAGNNYFPFLPRFYRSHRAKLFRFLAAVPLYTSTQDESLVQAIAFIQAHSNSRKPWLSTTQVENSGTDEEQEVPILDLSWIPKKWWFLVTGQRKRKPYPTRVHRKYFEICVFSHILLELQSGDLYIEGSSNYEDYYQQLISWQEYEDNIEEFGQLLDIPIDPEVFVEQERKHLEDRAQQTDLAFPENSKVSFKNSRPVIHRRNKHKPEGAAELRSLIAERMRPVGILDVLSDTEEWLNWTRFFKPISGFEGKIDNPISRYLATSFCYGCNIGPSQLSRSLEDFDRRQLYRVHQRHISIDKLQKAIETIINAYNRFDLPRFWGTGKSTSVDGTKWDIYENNLLAEYHIRYGGYGGLGYYHLSDTYIALFSNFIPCGVWEAVYLLDGLEKNTSDIQPDTVHGDTQAQSATVYGLAHLLGIKLMPRIRKWQDLKFYRPKASSRYQHIDELFTDVVDWRLIQTHFKDMLRVILSIKMGRINPSTILRKLGTNSRKNKLFKAFHALGSAVRTGFLLEYIDDEELRAMIQNATTKSEAFNAFVKWLTFGGQGVINTNNRDELRKRIKYNHLVANCLIFYNVVEMSRIIRELIHEGHTITAESIASMRPFLTRHANRLGQYSLNMSRKRQKLDFKALTIPLMSS